MFADIMSCVYVQSQNVKREISRCISSRENRKKRKEREREREKKREREREREREKERERKIV